MYDVVLFGGTDEGHKIADFLSEQKVSYVVCVATEYGAELLDMKNVRVGRMTAEEMADFFRLLRTERLHAYCRRRNRWSCVKMQVSR